MIEAHYACVNIGNSSSICNPICGDSYVVFLKEECDDGNKINGDGCSSICKI